MFVRNALTWTGYETGTFQLNEQQLLFHERHSPQSTLD